MKKIDIARIAHEVNRAYCDAIGDKTQVPWEEAPQWQKDSAVQGVAFTLSQDGITPEQSHDAWSAQKVADGWIYGAIKDPRKKEHPCLVPYHDLPESQRIKDYLFQGVCAALKPHTKLRHLAEIFDILAYQQDTGTTVAWIAPEQYNDTTDALAMDRGVNIHDWDTVNLGLFEEMDHTDAAINSRKLLLSREAW